METRDFPVAPLTYVWGERADGTPAKVSWTFDAGVARLEQAVADVEVMASAVISASITIATSSWSTLAGRAGAYAMQRAEIHGDPGTHADPVTAAVVPNNGIYGWTSEGWAWLATAPAQYPAGETVQDVMELGSRRQRYLDRLRTTDAAKPKAAVIILLGQSLNAPRGTILQARGAPGAKMPIGGGSNANWGFNDTNAEWSGHWSEMASVVDAEERGGQTPMVGIVAAMAGGRHARTYIASAAIGARSLEILMADGPVTNVWALLQRLCALARADGYDPEVMIYSAHGEANAYTATSEATYYALGMEYYGRVQLYAAQAMRRPGYIAPVVLTYPSPGTVAGQSYADVRAAIRRIATDLPGGISMGGIYHWPIESDQTHPTPAGSIKRGEAVGRVLRRYADGGGKWPWLHIVDVTLSGTQFVATFSMPVQRDAALNVGSALNAATAKDGFEWLDNGSPIAISNLVYEGWTVRGTLATAPSGTLGQQVLRLGSQLILAGGTYPTMTSGSFVRATEPGWLSIHDPTYVNYTWAAPQSFGQVRAP